MREHDKIVKNIEEQLRSKGVKIIDFQAHEAGITQRGYRTLKRKITHGAFRPDIVFSSNENDEERFFLEYIHTKSRVVHDLRGMLLLSALQVKARGFIVILNDAIFTLDGILDKENVFQLNKFHLDKLSAFLKDLKKSKEIFLEILKG